MKEKIFISSIQKEFVEERKALKAYVLGDALLSRFFDVFLFEDIPARDRRADEVYIEAVRQCDHYLALLGEQYGGGTSSALSPLHREFNEAKRLRKPRLIFIKGGDDSRRHPKIRKLIAEAGRELIRRRFMGIGDLIPAVYASLVEYLVAKELVRVGPFDSAVCLKATLKDISPEKVRRFVGTARRERQFPLTEKTPMSQVLEHLHLLNKGRPTNAAILAFGVEPQRFLISSEIKCAHFHGTEVSKPIPFYQIYKGTVFDLVEQSVNFVLSNINLAVGTREHSTQAPVAYEIPPEVVREAIVNAVAHRDYTSNGSVQVMLFSDRLEVWNPGALPPSLTLEKLRSPHGSEPGNPLIAEPLYLTKYIERMGTGILDMIKRCRIAGLPEPEFALTNGFVITIRRVPDRAFQAVGGEAAPRLRATPPVTQPVTPPVVLPVETMLRLLMAFGPLGNAEIRNKLGLKDRAHLRERYIKPTLAKGLIESTVPEKIHSRLQKYRLTSKGKAFLKKGVKNNP